MFDDDEFDDGAGGVPSCFIGMNGGRELTKKLGADGSLPKMPVGEVPSDRAIFSLGAQAESAAAARGGVALGTGKGLGTSEVPTISPSIDATSDLDRFGRSASQAAGLRNYYLVRAAVAAAWVAAAFSVGRTSPWAAAVLLIAYPAWDAVANLVDASRNGGLARNMTQCANAVVSAIAAMAVVAVIEDMNMVLGVFGGWAIVAGLLQLATGVRRWNTVGAQWAMVLSGAQSVVVGYLFVGHAFETVVPDIGVVAPYAAFGAFYFAISAVWLLVRRAA